MVLPLFMVHCRGGEPGAISVPEGREKVQIENASVPSSQLIPQELLRRREK
jgi:hypothetical protein